MNCYRMVRRRNRLLIVFLGFSLIFIILQIYTFFFNGSSNKKLTQSNWQQMDKVLSDWELQQLSKQSYANVQIFLELCKAHQVPVFLIDLHILTNVMTNNTPSNSYCKYLCVQRTYTSFGVLVDKWENKPQIVTDLQKKGFQVFLFTYTHGTGAWSDTENGGKEHLTTHYLLQREGHAVHLILFYHHQPADFWWHGPLSVSHMVQGNLNSLAVKIDYIPFSLHQGAYERVELVKVEMDSLRMLAPKYPHNFMKQIPSSQFIPCNQTRAQIFHDTYGKDKSSSSIDFRKRARTLLADAKRVLDELEIPFWLSSGTCLGWYRQCDIIPYSHDIDIGIWIKHYDVRFIPAMQLSGMPLKHLFGKTTDSYELSFQGRDVKLDVFFFYEAGDIMWNGGTQAKTGKKFKYIFSKFELCWTDFMGMKVRIPCGTETYLTANYGPKWFEPVTKWDWKKSPSNVYENGVWLKEEWKNVIQVFS